MAPKWRFLSLVLIFILPLGVTFVSKDVATAPNGLEVLCLLDSIVAPLQDHQINNNIVLPVYMTNVVDSIFGFTLWVRSNDPEHLRFGVSKVDTQIYMPGYDTVISFKAKFDTVGTRSRGFEKLEAQIQDAMHGQVKIYGICDNGALPYFKPIPPGSGILLKLIMESTVADSLCDSIKVKKIGLHIDPSQTSFSNEKSQTIGCVYETDTIVTHPGGCKVYAPPPNGDSCIAWWDTVLVIRERCVSIDPTKVVLLDGSSTFTCGPPCQCGDANSSGGVNISDAVFLISYIFSGGAAPAACNYANGMGDANGSGTINISDAVYLISYIFSGGAAPHCQ
jgi:hypothetical protein